MMPIPVSVETLYRSLSTDSLLELRRAFQIDRTTALGDQNALAFIDQRLRLIALELGSRTHVDDEGVPHS